MRYINVRLTYLLTYLLTYKAPLETHVCLSVRLFVCLSPRCLHKNVIFSETNLEQWCLLTTNKKFYVDFSKNRLLHP